MMSVKQTFKLYDVVFKYFKNEEDSKVLVSEIEEIMDNKVHLKMTDFATKKDFSDLKQEMSRQISDLRHEVRQEITALRTDSKMDISNLTICMEQGFKDHLKWTIILMLGFSSLIITVVKLL